MLPDFFCIRNDIAFLVSTRVNYLDMVLGSLSIRLFRGGGGEGEERKGKREEKPDTKALSRVFRPLNEHDASP